ncbi:hypothetical protein [Fibrobacter sp. UWEL]|uniref:hypothetical protein n=1 Tax=Fibrobacter sp. UWEL TaxID=1896209 RepID=UPI0009175AFD|nr:hypothetical protein [Fibrobacter sp. UWEL]SHK96470.1 hypothetical protein SAMN05720468_11079 [Fibrobacter sp. UWEL]
MKPVIHGIFTLETPAENRVQFNDAVYVLRKHFDDVLSKAPATHSVADGAPTVIDEAGGLQYKTTDEFWLFQIDYEFWTAFAKKFPSIEISLYYGSIFAGEDCGMFLSNGGNISDIRYENGSPDALEFSKSLDGMDGLHEEET